MSELASKQISILVKKLADIVGKQDKTPQLSIFDIPLERFINLKHELCILSGKIDWDSIEKEFTGYFSEIGRPSVPIRRMVGLLLLKHIYNLSDEAKSLTDGLKTHINTGIPHRNLSEKVQLT